MFVKYILRISLFLCLVSLQGCASYKLVEAKISNFVEKYRTNSSNEENANLINGEIRSDEPIDLESLSDGVSIASVSNDDLTPTELHMPSSDKTPADNNAESSADEAFTIEEELPSSDEFAFEEELPTNDEFAFEEELPTNDEFAFEDELPTNEVLSTNELELIANNTPESESEIASDLNDAPEVGNTHLQTNAPDTPLLNNAAQSALSDATHETEALKEASQAADDLVSEPPVISSPAHSKQASLSPKTEVEPYVLPVLEETADETLTKNVSLIPAPFTKTASHAIQSDSDDFLGISSQGESNSDSGYIDILGTTNTITDQDEEAIQTEDASEILIQYEEDDGDDYSAGSAESIEGEASTSISVKEVMAKSIEKPFQMQDPIPTQNIPEFMKVMTYSDDLINSDGFMIFQTRKGKLKENIIRLLSHTDADTNIIWNVSEQHTIFNDYWIKGKNVVDILDKILISYNDPHPINAELWLNRVVTIQYDKKNRRVR